MIKNLIFDLGGVLVDLDYERFRKNLMETGVKESSFYEFFDEGNYRKLGYEEGKISTKEFVDISLKALGGRLTRTTYTNLFNDMFLEKPEMKSFINRVSSAGDYELLLLSNTSPMHFSHIRKCYGYVLKIRKLGLSYRLKYVKPDPRIFKAMVRKFSILPEESLFVDDKIENCRAAEEQGFMTINFTNYGQFMTAFNNLVKQKNYASIT